MLLKPLPKRPGGPKGSYLLGSTKHFASNTLGFVEDCQRQFKDMAYAKIAFRDFYIVYNPQWIQHVLQTNYKNYKKSFAYNGFKQILGNGLLTSEGDFWLKQRRLAQPAFHKEQLNTLVGKMVHCTREVLDEWELQKNSYLNINEEMRKLSEKIVTVSLFSTEVKGRSEQLNWILERLRNFANEKMKNPFMLPLIIPTKRNKEFQKAMEELDTIIYAIIAERQQSGSRYNDLLGMLMSAEDADTGEKMSIQQLRDEVATLFIAGQETTANALCFIFYMLSQHPEVEKKVADEVKTVVKGATFRLEELSGLVYTTQVIKEVMRLYPPAWAISRTAVNRDVLGQYEIPKGATIFLSIYALHRHASYWKDADKFRPERFSPEEFGTEQKSAYMPFGTGARICIGNNFAMMEMQIVTALLVQKYYLKCSEDFDPKLKTPITLSFKNTLFMKPELKQNVPS